MNQNLLITISLIIGLGVGFWGGIKYQELKQPRFQGFGNRQGQMMMRTGENSTEPRSGNRMGFRPVAGEIIKADDSSITVKLEDGSTKMILLTEKMVINKAEPAEKEALAIGEHVAIFGSENQDGSITAQNIQLNPQEKMLTRPERFEK